MKDRLTVSLVQMDSTDRVRDNLDALSALLADAPSSDLIVLPELCLFRGGMPQYADVAEPVDGAHMQRFADLSQTHSCWLLAGSIAEREQDNIYNASLLFNPQGECTAVYRKLHLFGLALDSGTHVFEAETYTAGNAAVATDLAGWQAGLSICYDLRFPELYRALAHEGLDLILAPADFTAETGKAHWETLCRSRAIENQCYLVAANQCGTNRVTGTASYGHSLIIDPWGDILAEAGDTPCVLTAELSANRLDSVRRQLPALSHRRL